MTGPIDLSQFVRPAAMAESRLRMAIQGPAGCGKTYTSLLLASHLGHRICVIDTEHNSADKYAADFRYGVTNPEAFRQTLSRNSGTVLENDPRLFTAAIKTLAPHFDVLIIDSGSLAWTSAKDSIDIEKKRFGGNAWSAWSVVTPRWEDYCNAILSAPCHVIVTMRVKTEWSQEKDSRGRVTPREVGLAPVWRDDARYLFDLVMEMDVEHVGHIGKSRCFELAGRVVDHPGEDLAKTLSRWLAGSGASDMAANHPSVATDESKRLPATSEPAQDSEATGAADGHQDTAELDKPAYLSHREARVLHTVGRLSPEHLQARLVYDFPSRSERGVVRKVERVNLDGFRAYGWRCSCPHGQHVPKGREATCIHARQAEVRFWLQHMSKPSASVVLDSVNSSSWDDMDQTQCEGALDWIEKWQSKTLDARS
jgi:hypothetical protein